MINIILEPLRDGNVRVTGRNNGTTMEWMDVATDKAKTAVQAIMEKCAWHHQNQLGEYDMTWIRLNDAAQQALNS